MMQLCNNRLLSQRAHVRLLHDMFDLRNLIFASSSSRCVKSEQRFNNENGRKRENGAHGILLEPCFTPPNPA